MTVSYRIAPESEDFDRALFLTARRIGATQTLRIFAGSGDLCRLRHVPTEGEDTSVGFSTPSHCDRCPSSCKSKLGTELSKVVLGNGAVDRDPYWLVLASTPCGKNISRHSRSTLRLLIVFSPLYESDLPILPTDMKVFGFQGVLRGVKDDVIKAIQEASSPSQLVEIAKMSLEQRFGKEIEEAKRRELPLLVHFLKMWRDRVKCYGF
jgi:hypothetical protein